MRFLFAAVAFPRRRGANEESEREVARLEVVAEVEAAAQPAPIVEVEAVSGLASVVEADAIARRAAVAGSRCAAVSSGPSNPPGQPWPSEERELVGARVSVLAAVADDRMVMRRPDPEPTLSLRYAEGKIAGLIRARWQAGTTWAATRRRSIGQPL